MRVKQIRGHAGDGVIVTARDLVTGETRSWHEPSLSEGDGPNEGRSSLGALTRIVAELRRLNEQGAQWRVVAISSVATIYRDICGGSRRRLRLNGQIVVDLPEPILLKQIDAFDLYIGKTVTPAPVKSRSRWKRWRLR